MEEVDVFKAQSATFETQYTTKGQGQIEGVRLQLCVANVDM